jgi:2'-5' RNA ligase
MKHRVFIALTISPPLQKEILEWEKKLPPLPVRWLEWKNLHITLVPPWYEHEEDLGKLKSLLKEISGAESFKLNFRKVTFGPDPHRPRLIWAEGPTPRAIEELQDRLFSILNLSRENRPFKLHLTLARFRPETFSSFSVKKLEEKVFWEDEIKSVALMESHLTPQGADYKLIIEAPLG